jgi:hypothetical protein
MCLAKLAMFADRRKADLAGVRDVERDPSGHLVAGFAVDPLPVLFAAGHEVIE